jgi:hypothetical protein
LVARLDAEDCALQSMPSASPAKWHLAHTTWFFEQFVLREAVEPRWQMLFNSYYESVGPQHPRPLRGHVSRPSLRQVLDYRARVDEAVQSALARGDGIDFSRVELGLNHEQQHQELLLTDIKHAFSLNPLLPAYAETAPRPRGVSTSLRFVRQPAGLVEVGPRRRRLRVRQRRGRAIPRCCAPFARRSAGQQRENFARSSTTARTRIRGCGCPTAGSRSCAAGLEPPDVLAGRSRERVTLGGVARDRSAAPVCHVSYYEADAFARWAGARACRPRSSGKPPRRAHPARQFRRQRRAATARSAGEGVRALFGDVWEVDRAARTCRTRLPSAAGALGEYNGKFMCSQMVLRGGSCATPEATCARRTATSSRPATAGSSWASGSRATI